MGSILHAPGWFMLIALLSRLLTRGDILHVPDWLMLFTLLSRLLARGLFYMHLVGLCCLLCSLGCWLGEPSTCTWLVNAVYSVL